MREAGVSRLAGVESAVRALTDAFHVSVCLGGGTPVEADPTLNGAARAVVEAYRAAYGEVWLGRINRAADERGRPPTWRNAGEIVYNFSAEFVLPACTPMVDAHIIDREAALEAGPYSMRADAERITRIHAAILGADGAILLWS